MLAYVGTRTTRERNARGEGISVFAVGERGRLDRVQLLDSLVNPSYLALNRAGTRLYAVHGDGHEASSFAVRADGTLQWLSSSTFPGRNPVHLALDPGERWLVVAVHLAGEVVVFPIADDGRLGQVCCTAKTFGDPGPHRVEQPFAKPHFNPFDPGGRFVVVPDKGVDRVFVFRFDGGQLVPTQQGFVQAREGAGPRNAVFHPDGTLVYVVNELDSTLATYAFDAATGAMRPLAILPTLASTFTGNSRAAGIAIDRAGRHLYTSNRGDDSIALFALDGSGGPHFIETVASGGRTPRFFTLSPDGSVLYALNEDSDNIVAFAVDGETGRLSATGVSTTCGSPVCMVFSPAGEQGAR